MYAFGSSGGLRARCFNLKSTLSRVILQGARFITYAHLALQGALFAYRTRFRFRYAEPLSMSMCVDSLLEHHPVKLI
jgi:hypothetical protein